MKEYQIRELLDTIKQTCKRAGGICRDCPIKNIIDECYFKRQPQHWDNEYMAKRITNHMTKPGRIIVLDTETTGIDPDDEILQLSIIDENENILYNGYFRPRFKTSWPGAEAVNHISPEMVSDKPTIFTKQSEIQKILDSADTIVGYNTEFDLSMLRRSGIYPKATTETVDVMKSFANYYGDYDPRRNRYKYKSLKFCAENLGYKSNNLHDSLEDCKATLFAYKKLNELY